MVSYIIRRLLQLVLVLVGVTVITFVIMYAIPGDPARMLAGKNTTPERIEQIRVQLGLDKPVYVQYVKFVGAWRRGTSARATRCSARSPR
jgi:peptide/nickel transport system permease protein